MRHRQLTAQLVLGDDVVNLFQDGIPLGLGQLGFGSSLFPGAKYRHFSSARKLRPTFIPIRASRTECQWSSGMITPLRLVAGVPAEISDECETYLSMQNSNPPNEE